jgi:RNA polymerase sigma factor (sigma-70 family)
MIPIDTLQDCVDRLQSGHEQARHELLNCACERLRRLTGQMLHYFPGVRRWEDTDDVFQNAALRLCAALKQVTPRTVNEFIRLAALQIRRELIDLARHYYGPHGHGAHHLSNEGVSQADESSIRSFGPTDSTYEPSRLAIWSEFHEHVEQLPEGEREVFDLLWYQGLTRTEAATVLGVNERTVLRRWQQARIHVHRALQTHLPGV